MANDIVLISITKQDLERLVTDAVDKALGDRTPPQTPERKALNFSDGCKYVGISKSTGYKLTSQNKIPHSKRGKRIYFNKAELDKWLLAKRIPTIDEMEAQTDAYLNRKKRN